jgi:membrane associated rhomboid family serine protease
MRYQYTSTGYQQSFKPSQNSGVMILLMINIIAFIILGFIQSANYELYYSLFNQLSLIPGDVLLTPGITEKFQIWQCLTYLFLHGGIIHLFFNMLGLWFLGRDLEHTWGKENFIKYYLAVGIGSGLLTVIYNLQFINANDIRPIVGASGAIYGLLLAYGVLFPNRILYIYGIFPVKVKNVVIFSGSIAFFYSITLSNSGISHITHLAGIIVGIVYLQYWTHQKQSEKILKLHDNDIFTERMNRQKKMDQILDKVIDVGWDGLSREDKDFLKEQSGNYRDNENPN